MTEFETTKTCKVLLFEIDNEEETIKYHSCNKYVFYFLNVIFNSVFRIWVIKEKNTALIIMDKVYFAIMKFMEILKIAERTLTFPLLNFKLKDTESGSLGPLYLKSSNNDRLILYQS